MMNKTYLIVFSSMTNIDLLVKAFDKHRKVEDYIYSMPNSIFVSTSLEPKELTHFVLNAAGGKRVFVTEISNNSAGFLPKQNWDIIKRKI